MSRFFINNPIVAMVIAILFVIGGAVMVFRLPVAQFPEIAPPQIETTAMYTGADALTVEQSVATPIDAQVNGAKRMIYMQAISGNDGTMTLQVSFETGTDIDIDQVQVQNRLAQAQANLPKAVNNYGLTTIQTAGIPLLVFTINSPKKTWDQNFLSNYVVINVKDELARVPGIGQVKIFGAANYAMRVWVAPDTIAKLGLTVTDLVNAITAQNVVNPAGTLGGEPAPPGRKLTYTVRARGRLMSAEEFGDIVVRANADGSLVRLEGRRPPRARRRELHAAGIRQRCPGDARRPLPGPRVERARCRQSREGDHGPPGRTVPLGHARRADARHDRPRDRGREGDRHHAARGDRARHPGRLRLPPELAGHAHPHPHHSGVPRRHLRVLPDARVHDQHALAPRARARRRPRRRRRDRGGRGDRGEDRAGPVAARCGAPGDGRGERRARRHRARALQRVHPRRLHRRHHRVALPAVRAHHRVLGPDLRLQRAHAEPRARRAHPPSAAQGRTPRTRSDGSSPGSIAPSRRRRRATSGACSS